MSSTRMGMAVVGGTNDNNNNNNESPDYYLKFERRLQDILERTVFSHEIQEYWKPEMILSCFDSFLQSRRIPQQENDKHSTTLKSIAKAALVARQEFHQIEATTEKKACRTALEEATVQLIRSTNCKTSGTIAAVLVGLSLALDGAEASSQPSRRSIASAIGAALQKEEPQGNSSSSTTTNSNSSAISHCLFAALFEEATSTTNSNNNPPSSLVVNCPMDCHIVSGLAKAMSVSCDQDDNMTINVAKVIRQSLDLDTSTDHDSAEPTTTDDAQEVSKSCAAASLSMAAQLEPWRVVEPKQLVEVAIGYDLWVAAERICASAISSSSPGNNSSGAEEAVEALLEGSFDAKLFRQADKFATTFFESGGKRRYLEARYLHACGTISKLVQKGALPVIDKQVDRVDKAAQKMLELGNNGEDTDTASFSVTPASAQAEIRTFVLQQLEETGNVDTAQRLATLWGIDYAQDEEAVLAAQKARRAKYLQWEDFLSGNPPDLISTPEVLVDAMEKLQKDEESIGGGTSKIFGFDAEWNENDTGVDLLQIASFKRVILVDIPTLSSTAEGVDALEKTIGRVFASSDYTKVGFSCRQDLTKLRTPRKNDKAKEHWFRDSHEVVDLQTLVASADIKLSRFGLSRVCDKYLGKPLDKSEQCSYWNARPLSLRQRTYAALDAWTVRAIYDKLKTKR